MELERPPTKFERKVFGALHLIPRGMVTTYGLLGRHLSCRSAQAIGQALRRNPFAPDTPCHRVIKGDFTIGGFAGQNAGDPIDRKRRLLEVEGITFLEDGSIDPACCFHFDERSRG
jgi:methylated-DNA-[protein]-cysteine S-methyltransferase|tara:strand:+ start:7188 stop:7535 length:348 start_codon:yes stop_codon:yes gene_type:complete